MTREEIIEQANAYLESHIPMIKVCIMNFCNSKDIRNDREDYFQNACITVLKILYKREKYSHMSELEFERYICKAIENGSLKMACSRCERERKKTISLSDEYETVSDGHCTPEADLNQTRLLFLESYRKEANHAEQLGLEMIEQYAAGFSYDEIAVLYHTTNARVRSTISRVRGSICAAFDAG